MTSTAVAPERTHPTPAEPDKPRAGSSLLLRLAVFAYLASRIWVFLFVTPISPDRILYFKYAVRGIDSGRVAFADFEIEYPPVGYWAMAAPRLVDGERLTPETVTDRSEVARQFGRYSLLFRLQMLILDAVAFGLFLALVRRSRPEFVGLAAWGYVLSTTALHHVLLDRLDVGLLALLLGWLWTRSRVPADGRSGPWNAASYAILGFGIAFKLVGVVALPFVLLSDFRAGAGGTGRRLLDCVLLTLVAVVATALPFAVHAPFAGWKTLGFLEFHGARGIQIESIYASGLFVASWFGLPIETAVAYGSANVESSWSALLTRASPFVLLAALAALGLTALMRGRDYDRRAGELDGVLAILLTLVLSKVLSEQYFLFGLPLLLLATAGSGGRGRFAAVVVACFVIGVGSTVVFPHLWFPVVPNTNVPNAYCLVPDLHWLPCMILVVRNALFMSLVTLALFTRRGGTSS